MSTARRCLPTPTHMAREGMGSAIGAHRSPTTTCSHFGVALPTARPLPAGPALRARSLRNARRRAPSTGGGFMGGLNAMDLLQSKLYMRSLGDWEGASGTMPTVPPAKSARAGWKLRRRASNSHRVSVLLDTARSDSRSSSCKITKHTHTKKGGGEMGWMHEDQRADSRLGPRGACRREEGGGGARWCQAA